jgi:hypothetical protein
MATPMLREAVALFDDAAGLEQAVSELRSRGFDHADLSLLAPDALAERPDASAERMADDPATRRQGPVTETDIRQERALGTGMAATVAGFAAAGFSVATGGLLPATIVAAGAAAGGAAAIGTLIGHMLDRDEAAYLDAQLARGGVLLWVRTPDQAAVRKAVEILRRHSAHVHVHDIPATVSDETPRR